MIDVHAWGIRNSKGLIDCYRTFLGREDEMRTVNCGMCEDGYIVIDGYKKGKCPNCKGAGSLEAAPLVVERDEEPPKPNVVFDFDGLVETVYKSMCCSEDLTKDFIEQVLKSIKVFDAKQRDYGEKNISEFGEMGVHVRMSDKFARLKNLCWKNGKWQDEVKASNESIEDTLLDIGNYAIIATMCRNGTWPL